jgi:serine/threonine protein kinase/tetratricopeptide (TPR) repeat protein
MSATASDSGIESLVEQLAAEMTRRWHEGERPTVENLLDREPKLRASPEAIAELVLEELALREQFGEPAPQSDLERRFPHLQAQLRIMLDFRRLLEAGADGPSFPEVGEQLGDFHLEAELGHGKQGRVFLARHLALADRPVVLKLVPLLGREHLCLARMQHTHIVPLYFIEDYPERMLRALCLPYFGGKSLEAVLDALGSVPPARRSGRQLREAVGAARSDPSIAIPLPRPAARFLSRATYIQAVCRIGACLADALHYAHERGVLHLDLKPANVLIAADGQPMLLDFHLARGPLVPGSKTPEWLGGTPAYMAPEQRAAWEALRDGRPITAGVDARADLFALGVMLYEMLSGTRPALEGGLRPELQRRNPFVSRGLADIVGKCLAVEPTARYSDAAALAHDLRRHLQDLPLHGVVNRSPIERWRKWRRRRPFAPAVFAVVAALVILIGSAGVRFYQHRTVALAALDEGKQYFEQQKLPDAGGAFMRGIVAIDGDPFSSELKRELQERLQIVNDRRAAQDFHQFVEQIRVATGADSTNHADAQAVADLCRKRWDQRHHLIALDPEDNDLQHDMVDLAIMWRRLLVRIAPAAELDASRRESIAVLVQAERWAGAGSVVHFERRQHAIALGLKDVAEAAGRRAESAPPRTAWEYATLGRSLLDGGDPKAALAHLDRALELKPDDFWAAFHKGRCARSLKLHDEAITAFTACVTIAAAGTKPQTGLAWCFYNRALAYLDCDNLTRARRDLDCALGHDPNLGDAWLERGLLNHREKRYEAATADLKQALQRGASRARAHYGLALVFLARDNAAAAGAELDEALRADPDHKPAQDLLSRMRRSS